MAFFKRSINLLAAIYHEIKRSQWKPRVVCERTNRQEGGQNSSGPPSSEGTPIPASPLGVISYPRLLRGSPR